MKFLFDQRLKHRIIGAVVIASIAAVFLPAMMKKSNYSFDQSTSVSIHLPANPKLPEVAVKDEKALFQTVKVAHVELPTIQETAKLPNNIRAQPISDFALQKEPNLAKPELLSQPAVKSVAIIKKPAVTKVAAAKVAVTKPNKKVMQAIIATSSNADLYGVQLASFSQVANAQLLVNKLRGKGYQASYSKSKNGNLYKVVVGGLKQKQDAISLQKKLSSNLQLNGFIVKGVG